MSSSGEPPQKRRNDWSIANAHKSAECQAFLDEKYNIIKDWGEEALANYGLSEHRFQAGVISENFKSATSRGDTHYNAALSNAYHRAQEDFKAGRSLDNPGRYINWLREAQAGVRTAYSAMTPEEREAQLTDFKTRRNEKDKSALKARKPGSGFSRSVAATGNRITKLVEDLNTAAGVEGIVILAPGAGHLPFTPMVHVTDTAKKFFKDVELNRKEPTLVAKMLEGYCASGMAGTADLRVSMTKTTAASARKDISGGIQDGLDKIMATVLPPGSTLRVKMNYRNMEREIVEPHGVALVGWPLTDKPVTQPNQLHAGELTRVKKALDDGTLRWERLSAQQLEERKVRNKVLQAAGQNVYIPRKPRTRKRRLDQVEA